MFSGTIAIIDSGLGKILSIFVVKSFIFPSFVVYLKFCLKSLKIYGD